jgi:hypothetical protein
LSNSLLLPYVEPLALAGALVAIGFVVGIIWRYRRTRRTGRFWRRRNWRLTQVCALTSLFYLALAASALVLKDVWGWLYLILAFKVGIWWLRRSLQGPVLLTRRR